MCNKNEINSNYQTRRALIRNKIFVKHFCAVFHFLSQVKIWFQNRRSKFKKLWKSGEIPPEQHVASSESPPCTSPPTTAWDFPQTPRMNSANPTLPQSSSPPITTAPSSFLANYSWYSSTNSTTHLQPLVQHHHNSAISAGTIF